jgi:hypothetical protein
LFNFVCIRVHLTADGTLEQFFLFIFCRVLLEILSRTTLWETLAYVETSFNPLILNNKSRVLKSAASNANP